MVSAEHMPFIKQLASSDGKSRKDALDRLKAFLSTKYAAANHTPDLAFDDAHKLWEGLFYALWMADRAPVQQRLCDDLASLPVATGLSDASTAAWLRGFWATMARKWTTDIDVLRMDKFLLLVRRVLSAQLAWIAGVQTDGKKNLSSSASGSAVLGLKVLEDWPLNPEAEAPLQDEYEGSDNDDDEEEEQDYGGRPKKRRRSEATTMHVPVGLQIHVSDIWVDELEKLGLVGGEEEEDKSRGEDKKSKSKSEAAAEDQQLARKVNQLVEALAARTGAPAVRLRSRESLADDRLPWNQEKKQAAATGGLEGLGGGDDDDDVDDDDASWDGFND